MSRRSDSPASDRIDGSSLDLSDASSTSDMNSDNSRDVNLNSKKFTDYNLFGADLENKNINNNNNKTDEQDLNFTSAIEDLNTKYNFKSGDKDTTDVPNGKPALNLGYDSEIESSDRLLGTKKTTLTTSSTPKPESADSRSYFQLFTTSTDSSPVESGNEGQTYTVSKTAENQRSSLTNEEVAKTFQDLSFAFKTDSMTIQKRLQLTKRKRDQAESNIENEVGIIKAKLKNLQEISLNSECVNLMTDLKKQLDFVLNASLQLSSSAEGYGYTQHEERLLELIGVMLQHVENLESSKADSTKALDKLNAETQRSPTSAFLENARDDDKILRRRSVATISLPGNSRRRASIATLPRLGNCTESGSSGKGSLWTTPSRTAGCAVKKLSFSQTSPRTHLNNLPETEDLRRDSVGSRHRKESRTGDISMTNIDETPEQRPSVASELVKEPIDTDIDTETNDSSLNLKQLFESIDDVRRNSGAQEHITAAYCLRRIIEWNKLLLSSARFRWPDNVLQYAPFYITWYIVFVLALVFIGGLFTGINGCYTYSCVKYTALWSAVPAFYSFLRRNYRVLLWLFLTFIFALTFLFFCLTEIFIPQLTSEEVDSLFRVFGLEIRYLNGPPPV